MNIDSIKFYPAVDRTKGKLKQQEWSASEFERSDESKNADKNIKVNRGYQSDSLAGIRNDRAVTFGSMNSLANKLAQEIQTNAGKVKPDNLFDKILKLCDDHTVIAQNLVALFLAVGPRPLAIMLLPGIKDKEDKMYASGHAIASGIIGFGFSSLVMYPLGQAASKAKKVLKAAKQGNGKELSEKTINTLKKIFNVTSLEELEHSKGFKHVTKIMDMAPDVFIFGILKAILTVKLIKPILKYGFGLEKKDKNKQSTDVKPTDLVKEEDNKKVDAAQITKSDNAENNKTKHFAPVAKMSQFVGGLK